MSEYWNGVMAGAALGGLFVLALMGIWRIARRWDLERDMNGVLSFGPPDPNSRVQQKLAPPKGMKSVAIPPIHLVRILLDGKRRS